MTQFLTDLATAHKMKEGFKTGSLSARLNNPGNLRWNQSMFTYYGAISGEKGFAFFPHLQVGMIALMDDLKAKITGTAGSIKNLEQNTGRKYEQLVMQDYVSIYAPSSENDPVKYCSDLCGMLSQYCLKPTTPLSQMAQLIDGTLTRIPNDSIPTVQQVQAQIVKETNPIKRNALMRLLHRLIFI